jgi:predicted esterase
VETRWSRRALLGAVAGAGVGAAAWALTRRTGPETDGFADTIPTVPLGEERVETRRSAARGRDVKFYTAVPDGHGDGRGLPVCLVLHGASATAADFPRFGLGHFLTDAVLAGAAPFVLAGATGDQLSWQPSGADDPQRMVHEEIPDWCAQRGFDMTRIAAWGWSMGGYGALLLAEAYPGFLRAVAAFSPAVRPGDAVFAGVDRLRGTRVGLWCGTDDDYAGDVRSLASALPEPARIASFTPGGHTRRYWNGVTREAFTFLAHWLHGPQ